MRIIGGKYGGQTLASFKADHIRPTTDRVKESLFNKWNNYVDGARVVDLFSGTGSLGLEALSRGALEVTFVDVNEKSIQILRKNIEKLKVAESHQIIRKDVLKYIRQFENEAFDLILIDPPFTEVMAHEVMTQLGQSKLFKKGTRVAIESGRREKIEDFYGLLHRYDTRDFGDKVLSLFTVEDLPLTGEER